MICGPFIFSIGRSETDIDFRCRGQQRRRVWDLGCWMKQEQKI